MSAVAHAKYHAPSLWCSCHSSARIYEREKLRLPGAPDTVRAIVAEELLRHGVRAADLFAKGRGPAFVSRCRDEIAYRLHNEQGWGLTRTGEYLGRDHSSVAAMIHRALERPLP